MKQETISSHNFRKKITFCYIHAKMTNLLTMLPKCTQISRIVSFFLKIFMSGQKSCWHMNIAIQSHRLYINKNLLLQSVLKSAPSSLRFTKDLVKQLLPFLYFTTEPESQEYVLWFLHVFLYINKQQPDMSRTSKKYTISNFISVIFSQLQYLI